MKKSEDRPEVQRKPAFPVRKGIDPAATHPITCFRPFYISLASPFAAQRGTPFSRRHVCWIPEFYPIYREDTLGVGTPAGVSRRGWPWEPVNHLVPRPGDAEFMLPSGGMVRLVTVFISGWRAVERLEKMAVATSTTPFRSRKSRHSGLRSREIPRAWFRPRSSAIRF